MASSIRSRGVRSERIAFNVQRSAFGVRGLALRSTWDIGRSIPISVFASALCQATQRRTPNPEHRTLNAERCANAERRTPNAER